MSSACALLAGLAIISTAVREEDVAPPNSAPPAPAPSLDLTLGAWMPRLGGQVELGGGGLIDLGDQLDVDGKETILNAELVVRKGERWSARIGGFDFSTEKDGTFAGEARFGSLQLADGERYEASVDLTSIAAEVGCVVLRGLGEEEPASLDFIALLGARWVDVDQSVQLAAGGRDSGQGEWLAFTAGLAMRLRYEPPGGMVLGRALTLEAGSSLGPAVGGDGGWVWQLGAGMTWDVTPNIGLLFGYRLLELDVENGDYSFDAGLQGLFVGGTIRF